MSDYKEKYHKYKSKYLNERLYNEDSNLKSTVLNLKKHINLDELKKTFTLDKLQKIIFIDKDSINDYDPIITNNFDNLWSTYIKIIYPENKITLEIERKYKLFMKYLNTKINDEHFIETNNIFLESDDNLLISNDNLLTYDDKLLTYNNDDLFTSNNVIRETIMEGGANMDVNELFFRDHLRRPHLLPITQIAKSKWYCMSMPP
jgi:hypothetical protein